MADPLGTSDTRPVAASEDLTAPDRAIQPVRRALRWLGLVLLAVMIALPTLQVLLREGTSSAFIGAGELTRFMLICVVFITLPYVVSSGANIRMEEILHALPATLQRGISILVAATGVLGFGIAAYSVAVATLRNLDNATPTLAIPYWIFFLAALVGLLFAALESAIQLGKAWRGKALFVSFAEEQSPDPDPVL